MGLFSGIGKALKGVAGAALGGISGGSLLSVGGSLLGGFMQNNATAKAAANAHAFTADMMKNRHQWEVQDLLAAGLNPVLSANGTLSMGSSAVADVPSNPFKDAAATAMQNRLVNAQIKNMEADTDKKRLS